MDVKKFRDRTFPIYRDMVDGRVREAPASDVRQMVFQKGIPKILITNVIEYFADNWRDASDMLNNPPNAAPPFNICWLEGRIPEYGYGITAEGGCYIAAMFLGFDIMNPGEDSERTEPGLTDAEKQLFEQYKRPDVPFDAWEDVRWITHFVGAIKPPEELGYHETWAPTFHMVHLVKEDGKIAAGVVQGFGVFSDGYLDSMEPEERNEHNIIHLFSVVPPMLAISFLHCKNVELVEQEHTFHLDKRASSGRLKKKSKMAKVRYHMLTVEPIRKILATEGQIERHGMQKALHICRGHFKDYREHGLFGKHKGIYWWNQQLRGSQDRGVMIKDYKELAPK